jgi:hypothetical protein
MSDSVYTVLLNTVPGESVVKKTNIYNKTEWLRLNKIT